MSSVPDTQDVLNCIVLRMKPSLVTFTCLCALLQALQSTDNVPVTVGVKPSCGCKRACNRGMVWEATGELPHAALIWQEMQGSHLVILHMLQCLDALL